MRRGNGCEPCCGREPMLRVRPRVVFTTLIAYVRYECAVCGHCGGLGLTEDEARFLWP